MNKYTITNGVVRVDISTNKHNDTFMLCDEEDWFRLLSLPIGRITPLQDPARKSVGIYASCRVDVNGKRKPKRFHRLVMGETDLMVDHINHDTLDNRKCNLRLCNHSQNAANRKVKPNTSSKYLGVYRNKCGRWVASVRKDMARHYAGTFDNEIDAAKSYNDKALELHGEFARLNRV